MLDRDYWQTGSPSFCPLMMELPVPTVIVQVVLSWVGPYSPVMPLLNSMTRPFMRVFQRRIPPVGNVDLSPLFVLVVIQLLLILPVAWAEAALARLL